MFSIRHAFIVISLLIVLTGIMLAQRRGGGGFRRGGYPNRSEFPMWENAPGFEEDVFTFARIKYTPHFRRGWDGDYPEADWNISYRLQELTSLKTNPHPVYLELTDPKLVEYPFIFIIAPRSVVFTDAEAKALRTHLLNGGFLMVDEFWGTEQWDHFYLQIKRVFPELEPRELSLDHPIFHNVYDLRHKPQTVAIHIWRQGLDYHPMAGTERDHAPHYYGLFDKKGRMMAILCYNNDLVDGWEREGDDIEYFLKFSDKNSYPMGINIIFYAMTH